jgi:membrane protein YqaA with SNARE-associated domain
LRYLQSLKQYLLVLGIPGLFIIALLDGAAIPMAGGPDALILLLAWQRPLQAPLLVLAATLGSALGCLVLYRIGRAGGGLALARLAPEKRARIKRKIERSAAWAIFLSVMAPPPFPTKLFILMAGVVRMPLAAFAAAVTTGRLIRYSLLGYLAARYGEAATHLIKERLSYITVFLLSILVLLIAINWYRRRRAVRNTT